MQNLLSASSSIRVLLIVTFSEVQSNFGTENQNEKVDEYQCQEAETLYTIVEGGFVKKKSSSTTLSDCIYTFNIESVLLCIVQSLRHCTILKFSPFIIDKCLKPESKPSPHLSLC